jgi:hypothetical protein
MSIFIMDIIEEHKKALKKYKKGIEKVQREYYYTIVRRIIYESEHNGLPLSIPRYEQDPKNYSMYLYLSSPKHE